MAPSRSCRGSSFALGIQKKNIAQFDSVCRFGRSSFGLFGLGFRERTMTHNSARRSLNIKAFRSTTRCFGTPATTRLAANAAICGEWPLWNVLGQDEQWPKLRLNMTKLDFLRHERWYTWYSHRSWLAQMG